jgi:hypothetical protein
LLAVRGELLQDAFGRGLVVGNPITADSTRKKDESEYPLGDCFATSDFSRLLIK